MRHEDRECECVRAQSVLTVCMLPYTIDTHWLQHHTSHHLTSPPSLCLLFSHSVVSPSNCTRQYRDSSRLHSGTGMLAGQSGLTDPLKTIDGDSEAKGGERRNKAKRKENNYTHRMLSFLDSTLSNSACACRPNILTVRQ